MQPHDFDRKLDLQSLADLSHRKVDKKKQARYDEEGNGRLGRLIGRLWSTFERCGGRFVERFYNLEDDLKDH